MPREKPRGVQLRRDALEVTPLQYAYLSGEWRPGQPIPEGESPFERFAWGKGSLRSLEDAWKSCRATILPRWIRARPGTRPWAWWAYDAPRWSDSRAGRSYAEPRTRLGGTGDPVFDCLNVVPAFEGGVPVRFVSRSDLVTWPDLRNPDHARPAEAHDPEDPPMYESEAAYLRRFDLFAPGEEKRLTDADFAPVPVVLTREMESAS